ncbi:MAG: Trehalose/maltose import ATP-binding protein MalK [Methanosaeta sp. PtaB.Bin039]|nr:MAG: Trehalose/maltose import ATP-binding protein MalK [Methanosaeta sp. PtaB.Bin039]OPY44489.1 MAG: Trehalose/maltose import ATP-binding protein MalK [Methanosaeta sp. PtaU1.Bin028]
MAILELQGIGLYRGQSWILREIDLEIARGEILGIIGPTGAGKTSLLRVIDLLEEPGKGRLWFDGKDMADRAHRLEGRRRMSMVFQRPAMLRGSVWDNVSYGLRIRKTAEPVIEEMVADLLKQVGLAGYRNRRASTLSGGEVQRVALARAMACRPDVLLLDEPTANLDPRTSQRIEGLISRCHDICMTIVISTHDLSQALHMSDRVAVMMDGQIAQIGRPDEIMEQPANQDVAAFLRAGNWNRRGG